jgi:hypothetical protein
MYIVGGEITMIDYNDPESYHIIDTSPLRIFKHDKELEDASEEEDRRQGTSTTKCERLHSAADG